MNSFKSVESIPPSFSCLDDDVPDPMSQMIEMPITIKIASSIDYVERSNKSIEQFKKHVIKQLDLFKKLTMAFENDVYKNYFNVVKVSLFRNAKMVRFLEVSIINEENLLEDMWMDNPILLSSCKTSKMDTVSSKVDRIDEKFERMNNERNNIIKQNKELLQSLKDELRIQLIENNNLSSKNEESILKNQFNQLEKRSSAFKKILKQLRKKVSKLERKLKANIVSYKKSNLTKEIRPFYKDYLLEYFRVQEKIKIAQDYLAFILSNYQSIWNCFKVKEKGRLTALRNILLAFLKYQETSYAESEHIINARDILAKLDPTEYATNTFPDSMILNSSSLSKLGVDTEDFREAKLTLEDIFLPIPSIISFVIWDHYNPHILSYSISNSARILVSNERTFYLFDVKSRKSIPLKRDIRFQCQLSEFVFSYDQQRRLLKLRVKPLKNYRQATRILSITLEFEENLIDQYDSWASGNLEILQYLRQEMGVVEEIL